MLAPGKSINTTLPHFHKRLPRLLERNHFKHEFIEHEMSLVMEGYVTGKTNSRPMPGRMNSITYNIEAVCRMLPSYNSIDLDKIEDDYLDWLTQDSTTSKYEQTRDYWVGRGLLDK